MAELDLLTDELISFVTEVPTVVDTSTEPSFPKKLNPAETETPISKDKVLEREFPLDSSTPSVID